METEMKISWVILTYNRANLVTRAIPHCMRNAGYPIDNIVWVDNGSAMNERNRIRDMFMIETKIPVTSVYLPKNLGVAKGYNTCMAMARGTHLVITGCDMLMPDNWLRDMVDVMETQPECGVSMIYAAPIQQTPERIRASSLPYSEDVGRIQEAMPIGRRLISIPLQREIGYFHEGFGMYGWDDVVWGNAAERVLKSKKLKAYCLIHRIAEHLGTEGNVGYDHKDEHEYWRWKKAEVNDPKKAELMAELSKQNWPRFSPY